MLLNVCIFFIFEMWVTLLQIVFYLFCFVLFKSVDLHSVHFLKHCFNYSSYN